MSDVDQPKASIRAPCRREDADAILRKLRENGHVAYFAGGCVRDLLLGLAPKDWDVATDAPPPRVRQLFPNTQAVGAAFGVILVREGKSVIEVATFRSDVSYEDGRRPTKVRFTTAEEDARRRDFTINGLFLDPIENKVIDYVGGKEDLKNKVLRAIGQPEHRFEEDHLRMLRAVRFASRFGLKIDPATYDAIRLHATRLKRISPERIAEELRLMLTPPSRNNAWVMLWEFRLLLEIFRYLPSPLHTQLDLEQSIFLRLAPGESIDFGVALAAGTLCIRRHTAVQSNVALIARDEATTLTRAMRQSLHLSNEEQEQMRRALTDTGFLLAEKTSTVAALKRIIASRHFPMVHHLLDAICAARFYVDKIESLKVAISEAQKSEIAPPPLLTGEDLIAMGLQPGKLFKVVLDQLYDAQLEGHVRTREKAIEFVKRMTE
ncbi:CCA tRNA nucleotidyltransferase [soil metagenome]